MAAPLPLLFDLDGTLVDTALMINEALSQLCVARGGETADIARTRRLVSRGVSALVSETLGDQAVELATDIAEFRTVLSGIPARSYMLYPGVASCLEAFRSAGHPCAVVTNKPEGLAKLALDQLDLARHFDCVVGGDTLPVCKPDPAPLRHALRALTGDEAQALFIGDSRIDSLAARAAGMPYILFMGGYEPECADQGLHAAAFDFFSELPLTVAKLQHHVVHTASY